MMKDDAMKTHNLRNEGSRYTDVLIIGGGGAGLRAAIAAVAGGAKVLVAAKSRIGQGTNTFISKAVVAASGLGHTEDSPEQHARDMLTGGAFLNDMRLAHAIARRARAEMLFLQQCGVPFSMDGNHLKLLQLPGHAFARHLFLNSWRGHELLTPLKQHAQERGVELLEKVMISRLFQVDGRIAGASGVTSEGAFTVIQAPVIILASGGYAQIYRNNNNVPGITGDGQALCYELGLPLKDMEFVQFYPLARGATGRQVLLYEKLLMQPGVVLKNSAGINILEKHGFDSAAAVTRDLLARLLMQESQKGRVVLDTQALSDTAARQLHPLLPEAWHRGQKVFAVVPTAHFCMGGVQTDEQGQTALPGLWAVGEVSAGAHGANRLGGNALAEIFTMGAIAGETVALQAREQGKPAAITAPAAAEHQRLEALFSASGTPPAHLITELKTRMWHNAGVLRHRDGLQKVLHFLQSPADRAAIASPAELMQYLEYRNMRLVSEMVCRAALLREESRGAHFRDDFPTENTSRWLKNIVLQKGDAGMQWQTVTVDKVPVEIR